MYPKLSDADLQDKKVLLRAGFDVPIKDGAVKDLTRPKSMVPTMKHILDSGAALIIMAHQGRPKGEVVEKYSQKPLVPVLEELLGVSVQFANACRGEDAQAAAANLQPGQVLLLENLRYDPAEKSKDSQERDSLGKELAGLADVYVNDAFTNCHRDHASMTSVPKYLPSYMGLQLEKEVENLGKVLDNPTLPLTLIVAGAKMETKVPVIEHYLDKSDNILLGGCIANTFIAASGRNVAQSRYEEEWVETAQRISQAADANDATTVHMPTDSVVADDLKEDIDTQNVSIDDIAGTMKIFDIGTDSAIHYANVIKNSGTIIWNGPVGVFEFECFAGGSSAIAQAIIDATENGATSIIGGGDSIDFFERYNFDISKCSFASTGGGAMLEFISGKKLPALEALCKK